MGKHFSTFDQRVDWMVENVDLWKGWPVTNKLTDDQLIQRMRNAGLISENANNYDIGDFGKLVAEARSRIRKK